MAHLTYFGVENFKRFEKFEMENIGQFNLMWGDNNVGKTSVLEALLFHPEPQTFRERFNKALIQFHAFDHFAKPYWWYFMNKNERLKDNATTKFILCERFPIEIGDNDIVIDEIIEKSEHILTCNFKLSNLVWKATFTPQMLLDGKLQDRSDEDSHKLNKIISDNIYFIRDVLSKSKDADVIQNMGIPFIPFFLGYDHNLTKLFNLHFRDSKVLKKRVLEDMSKMIPGIEDIFSVHDETDTGYEMLKIFQKDSDIAMPLGTFGDGAIKLFRILVEIIVHKGERLMIDEIDSGVHVSRFHDFLRAILLAAKEHNVQLFATTHNYECLKFFKEVLEEEEMQSLQANARGIKLITTPSGETKALTYTFEQFQYSFETNNDPRAVLRFAEDAR